MRRASGSSGALPRRQPCQRSFMRKTVFTTLAAAVFAASAAAQQPTAPRTVQLTVDDAVRLALEHNVDLSASRLDPQISDTTVAAATGAFKPTVTSAVNQNNQLQPP